MSSAEWARAVVDDLDLPELAPPVRQALEDLAAYAHDAEVGEIDLAPAVAGIERCVEQLECAAAEQLASRNGAGPASDARTLLRTLHEEARLASEQGGPVDEVLPHLARGLENLKALARKDESPFLSEQELDVQPPPSMLAGVSVPDRSIGMLEGLSQVGKTFALIDLMKGLDTGRASVFGTIHRTGPVVYVAGEGLGGVQKRLRAWRAQHGVGAFGRFSMLRHVPRLGDPAQFAELFRALRALPDPPTAVVFDTFNATNVGSSENDGSEVGPFLDGCRRIRDEFEAMVLWSHHLNQSGDKHRGHTSLFDDADFVIRMAPEGKNRARLECRKMKEAAHFAPIQVELRPVLDSLAITLTEAVRGIEVDPPAEVRRSLRLLSSHSTADGLASGAWMKVCQEESDASDAKFYRHRKALEEGGFLDSEKVGRSVRYTVSEKGRDWLGEKVS